VQARPVTLDRVAGAVAASAVALADPGTGRVTRVAVDGAVPADRALVADALTAAVAALGRPVARVDAEDFLRPRSVRLELGEDDPDAGYERWYDWHGLLREVLDPLGPGGRGEWLPALWDAGADRATRASRRAATPGTVAVVSGPFLLRWETADAVDLSVHLVTGEAALRRRLTAADADRVVGAWGRYVAETGPEHRADVVLRFDRPTHPALLGDADLLPV